MSDLPQLVCEAKAIGRIPREVAEKHVLAPLTVDGGTLLVAIADPANVIEAEGDLRRLTEYGIDFVPASREAILDALDRGYAALKRAPRMIPQPIAEEMAAAIRKFLAAAGVDVGDPELKETPARVAEAWIEDYLDGYRVDPRELLREVHPARNRELVIVKSIDFHSMCPHHLVPYRGVAHVGYVPRKGVVGFGKLVKLVDAFAHRLILQEQIGDEVTGALSRLLGARGAACVLEAEQACVTTRGPKRRAARTLTRSFTGSLARDAKAQAQFLRAVGLAPAPAAKKKTKKRAKK